ncbi:TonB-dependent receptor [Sphingomonas flavalba]|uniref:TonB-dependent receptor n=1 Tax=Sphingomonas flavalba TaxID=2559804 RepID=UPI00109E1F71|nr:TonB-dependent receptor [Sphingomonas flavalba]
MTRFHLSSKSTVRLSLIASVGATALAAASPVHAQMEEAAGVSSSIGGGDIVVTAQRKEENIQKVPVAITAFSGDAVEQMGFQRPVDVISQVPNMNFQGPFGDVGVPIVGIRGVQLYDYGDANESSVAMYIDDVYMGTISATTGQIFDVERVEVLRGPQGTLYGRNTTGGVIAFVSRKPTDYLSGSASAQYGSYNQVVVQGAISGPLSDTARFRVAGQYNRDDGWQKNMVLDRRNARTNVGSLRATLEFDATEDFLLTASAHYTRSNGTNQQQVFRGTQDPNNTSVRCSDAQILTNLCSNQAGFVNPNPKPGRIYSNQDNLRNDLEVWGGYLRADWQLADNLKLTSITAYEDVNKFVREDADASANSGGNDYVEAYSADTWQLTHETRLAGEGSGYDWVAGVFYYRDHKFVTSAFEAFQDGTYATVNDKSWALFGQANFEVAPRLRGILGVRYTEETRTLENLVAVSGAVVGTTQGTPYFQTSGAVTAKETTGRVGLEWQANDNTLVYATVSTGFKSPVYNTTTVSNQNAVGPVGAEKITAYELGSKLRFADGNATLNLATFYYDYRGIQMVGTEPGVNGAPTSRFTNLGDANIYGLEAEFWARPTSNFELRFSGAFLHTKIKAGPGVLVTGTPVDGKRLSNAPSFNASAMIRYTLPLDIPGELALQADGRFQTKVYFGPDNQLLESQGSYAVANFRIFWKAPQDKFEISAFVENAFNKAYLVHTFNDPGVDVDHLLYGRPRWMGVKLAMNF